VRAAVVNAANGTVVATRVQRATNPLTRGLGLLPKASVAHDEGLWIERCSAVHTIGMRASIDLFFLDTDGIVLRIVLAAKPFRAVIACRRASSVLELGARASGRDVSVGDRLVLQ
jgi:uncharacterized membrane protein (UPF0127 family)